MKTIQLFVVTLLMAIIPMCFISCGDKTGVETPDGTETPGGMEEDASILGEWECVNAVLKHDDDPSGGEDSPEKGQVWVFGEDELIIDGKSYTYKLSGSKLTTEYAELYNSSYFNIDEYTGDNLTLSVSGLYETQIETTTITVIMYFERIY